MTRNETEIISGLRILLRYFTHGIIDCVYARIDVERCNRKVRLHHMINQNELWVSDISMVSGRSYDTYKLELNDPRSVPVAIRTVCRRLGQDMPSFEAIDEILEKGLPAWMLEE